MTHAITRRTFVAATASAVATGALTLSARAAAEPLRVGFIYVGPVGDFGFSYQHDVARKAMQAALGDAVKTSFVEKVAEGPDAERVLRQLAGGGTDLIYSTSFGFMNPAERVARQFPKSTLR